MSVKMTFINVSNVYVLFIFHPWTPMKIMIPYLLQTVDSHMKKKHGISQAVARPTARA